LRLRVIAALVGATLSLIAFDHAAAERDSIITIDRSGSASIVSVVLDVDGRSLRVEGCSGGGCEECTEAVCAWGVPAGVLVTLRASSPQGFVKAVAADCLGGVQHSEIVPGIAQAQCTFKSQPGTMPIAVRVDRPTIRLRVDGPTTAEVLNPNRASDPIVLTVASGSGTVEVDRGDIVSFRQAPAANVPGRVQLTGFRGDCVSEEAWCNMKIDRPLVEVTATAVSLPLLP
jgi:hypothetical protein